MNLLNSDDLYADNALFQVAEKYKDLPEDVDIITCGVRIDFLDSKKKTIFHTNPKYLQFNMEHILFRNIYLGACFFRKKLMLNNPLKPLFKDGTIFLANDSDFLIRLALKGYKNTVIPQELCVFQASSVSFTFNGKHLIRLRQEWCHIALDFLDKTEDSAMKNLFRRFHAKSLTSLIMCHIVSKNFSGAINLFSAELKRNHMMWVCRFITQLFFIIYRKYKREKLGFFSLSN